jgi:hypothetical protein
MSSCHCLRRSSRHAAVGWGAALLALAALGVVGAAQAQDIGYVLSPKPTFTGVMHPNASYAFNSASSDVKTIAINRIATGTYLVGFRGLGNSKNSNVQISAYGSTTNYCTSGGWRSPNGTDVLAIVYCFDLTGAAADSGFTLLYQARTSWAFANSALGFFLGNNPTSAAYAPLGTYSFNSGAAANTATRSGIGSYEALIPGVGGFTGGHVQVTAVSKVATRCNVAEWSPGDVDLTCVDHAGNPVDAQYSVVFADNRPLGVGPETPDGAYAWNCSDEDTSFFSLAGCHYEFNNMSGDSLMARTIATGQYVVAVPGKPSYASSIALVTVYDDPSAYCNVAGWNPTLSNIYVNCFDSTGSPLDIRFDIAFQASRFK